MQQSLKAILTRVGLVLLAMVLVLTSLVQAGVMEFQTAYAVATGVAGLGVMGLTFLQNDDMIKYLISIGWLDAAAGVKHFIKAKTADYTIVTGTDASGTVFTNRGAAGAVIFTLPAPAQAIAGVFYEFLAVAAQNVTVKTATVDTLITFNDLTADSITLSTAGEIIGGAIRLICDGTSWIAYGTAVGAGGATAQTYTIAT